MRRTVTTTAATMLAVLALTGCTADTEQADPTPTPTPTPSTMATAEATAEAEGTTQPATITDPTEAKDAALAAGRPEAAWDQYCTAWTVPEADTEAQQWANSVAESWLRAHDAGCPDAIVWPAYYVQSFHADTLGELVVTLEAAAADHWVNTDGPRPGTHGLRISGERIAQTVQGEHPELESVTVTLEGSELSYDTTP